MLVKRQKPRQDKPVFPAIHRPLQALHSPLHRICHRMPLSAGGYIKIEVVEQKPLFVRGKLIVRVKERIGHKVHDRAERLHHIIGKVEAVQLVFMVKPQHGQKAVGREVTRHTAAEYGISVIESGIDAVIRRAGKAFLKQCGEITRRRLCLCIAAVPGANGGRDCKKPLGGVFLPAKSQTLRLVFYLRDYYALPQVLFQHLAQGQLARRDGKLTAVLRIRRKHGAGHMPFITHKYGTAALPQKGQRGCCDSGLSAFQKKRGNILNGKGMLAVGSDDELLILHGDVRRAFDNDVSKRHFLNLSFC